MKIGIIGAGSIGLLFAYYLQKHHQVTIYTRTLEQKMSIASNGLHLSENGHEYRVFVEARCIDDWHCKEDLTLITVKQYQLPKVMETLESDCCGEEGSFLFLQNGMGHLKWINQLKAKNIFVGSVEHGALRESMNHVMFTGKGKTKLAVFRGEAQLIIEMIDPYKQGFPFVIEEDYYEMLISKLIVNAVINPLTAVLKVKNGELIENPHYNKVFIQVFEEIMKVLDVRNKSHYFDLLVSVCRNTATNRSSMLRDIEEKRQTEVDAILGYLLEQAHMKEKEAPLMSAFYHCVKGSE